MQGGMAYIFDGQLAGDSQFPYNNMKEGGVKGALRQAATPIT